MVTWRRTSTAFLICAALFLAPSGAEACSAARLLGPEELVRTADAVVRVRAIGSLAAADPTAWPPESVRLELLEVLSGTVSGRELVLPGRIRDYAATRERRLPYDGVDCARAGGCGGCYAYDYKLGAQYLLLLKRNSPYWAALAPSNEEIGGSSDPWVVWVRQRLVGNPR